MARSPMHVPVLRFLTVLALLLLAEPVRAQDPPSIEGWLSRGEEVVTPASRRAWKQRIRLLREGSAEDRFVVRRELMAPEAWRTHGPAVREAMADRNPFIRLHAGLVLERMAAPSDFQRLADALTAPGQGGVAPVAIALGRLGGDQAARALGKALGSARSGDRRVLLLALGMTGSPRAAEILLAFLDGRDRKLDREAALLALGALGAGQGADRLEAAAAIGRERRHSVRWIGTLGLGLRAIPGSGRPDPREDDERIRIAAWARLARTRSVRLDQALLRRNPSGLEERQVRLLAIGRARASERAEVLLASSRAPAVRERAAALAGMIWLEQDLGIARLRAGLDDSNEEVSEVAALALVARALRGDTTVDPLPLARHPRVEVRMAGLLGAVALQHPSATALAAWRDDRHPREIRDVASELVALVAEDPPAARKLARFTLQRRLDDLGLAASWAVQARAHEAVLRILDLEDALQERGNGEAPGRPPRPTGGTGDRRPPPTATPAERDLRLHLDAWPLYDRRDPADLEFAEGR